MKLLLLWICSLGWCLASAAHAADPCPLTDTCVKDGHCTMVGGRCVVATEADCLQSRGCVDQGQCTLVPGPGGATCQATACEKTAACKVSGLCKTHDGECQPTADSCAKSTACKTYGACDLHYSGTQCTGASDCAERLNCKRSGACEAWASDAEGSDGSDSATCAPTTTQMCMASRDCQLWGRCQKDPDDHRCLPTAAACKRSVACREGGACDLGVDASSVPACVVKDDASCAGSKACKDRKACTAFGGACATANPPVPSCRVVTLNGVTATASSTHKASPPYTFDAANLVDQDLRTSWQPTSKTGASKGGVGEVLTLTLPRDAVVVGLQIGNGFQLRDKLGDLFEMNNRAARVAIKIGGETVVTTLADTMGLAKVRVPATATRQIQLEVLSVFEGTLWNDLAVSELRVEVCE